MRKSRNVSTIQTAKCVPIQFQWCTTGDQTNASISVHNILWKKQGVRFWGTWKGCTDHPPMVVWHSRENMEEQIQVHWSPMFPHTDSRNHECLNDIPEKLWVSLLRWITAPLWLSLCLPEAYSFHSLEFKDDGFIFLHYFNCRKNKKQTWDQSAK